MKSLAVRGGFALTVDVGIACDAWEDWPMSRSLVVVACALMLSAAPTFAFANEQGAAAGAVTGAVAGAVVGGPIGAVVGAVVGGVTVGAATGPSSLRVRRARGLEPRARYASDAVQRPSAGTVVMERTCSLQADGTPRCRRVR